MKTICAWCKKEMRGCETAKSGLVSHSICEDCEKSFFDLNEIPLLDFLDSLNVPIVVVNAECSVECVNKHARKILQKEKPEVLGYKAGNVFECVYSGLPGGCGGTIHCSGCSIRNSITHTMRTGEPRLHTPACLTQGTPEDNQEIKLLISTEKVADVVLLRIDGIDLK